MSDEATASLDEAREHASQATLHLHERDAWIRQAHRFGASLRTIAEAVGLTHAGVAKIVKREER